MKDEDEKPADYAKLCDFIRQGKALVVYKQKPPVTE